MHSASKNKEERVKSACETYLKKAKSLAKSGSFSQRASTIAAHRPQHLIILIEIEWFKTMLDKHIKLLERRVAKAETIPHEENVFSIFLPLPQSQAYTSDLRLIDRSKTFFKTK